MLTLDGAAQFAARYMIPRAKLEEVLRTGELEAGVLPRGGWVIYPADLEAWCEKQN